MHSDRAATVVFAIALVTAHRASLATIASAQSVPMPMRRRRSRCHPTLSESPCSEPAAGPPVNLRQFGASTLVEAGGKRLLFDCGRGATIRLVQAGIPIGAIGRLFLTHLHSDHVDADSGFTAGRLGRTDGTQGAARGLGTGRYARHDERTREGVRLRHSHPPGRGREIPGRRHHGPEPRHQRRRRARRGRREGHGFSGGSRPGAVRRSATGWTIAAGRSRCLATPGFRTTW